MDVLASMIAALTSAPLYEHVSLTQQLQMDMLIDVLDVKDRYFRVNVASDYGGSRKTFLMSSSPVCACVHECFR